MANKISVFAVTFDLSTITWHLLDLLEQQCLDSHSAKSKLQENAKSCSPRHSEYLFIIYSTLQSGAQYVVPVIVHPPRIPQV